MNEEKEISQLVKGICKAVKAVGVRKLVSKIHEINCVQGQDKKFDRIISLCMKEYGVKNELDLCKRYVHNNVKDARTTAIMLAINNTSLTNLEISSRFKKNHTIVSHAKNEFNGKTEKIKADRQFMETYNKLNEKLKNYDSL